jgi:formylglycine-generating enzyme required for sulfatase activity
MRKIMLLLAVAAILAGCVGRGTKGKPAAPETAGPYNFDMVFAEGGTFTMGCTGEQGDDCMNTEDPSHEVTINDFYISRYEITQAQWKAVMGSGDNPIEKVINGAVEGGGLSA